jgi:hypothetical protein
MEYKQGERATFLLDTGADGSVVNSEKLIGTTKFEPQQKVMFYNLYGVIYIELITYGKMKL